MMTDGQIAIEAMDLLLRESAVVPGSRIAEWTATGDPDVLSVVHESVSKARGRISGGVQPDVYAELVMKLFSVLLMQPASSAYALDRYDAARIYAAFVLQLVRDPALTTRSDLLRAVVLHLAASYKAGSESARRCIVDGVLEHVFPDVRAREAFSAWAEDPVLAVAYEEAADWDGDAP